MLKQMHWDDLPKERLSSHLERQFFTAGGVTVARFYMRHGLQIPTHHHDSQQVTNVIRGRLKMWIDGKEYLLSEGDVLNIPGRTPHQLEVLEDAIVLDIFSPPRTDWVAGEDAYLRGVTTSHVAE